MMEKPQPKREVAVDIIHRSINLITFYSTPDAIDDFRQFGTLQQTIVGKYSLLVDRRYDLDEVVKYLENYSTPS